MLWDKLLPLLIARQFFYNAQDEYHDNFAMILCQTIEKIRKN